MKVAHHLPPLNAFPFVTPHAAAEGILLTDRQRHELTEIGLRVRLPARMTIYRAGSQAQWVFLIADGVIKSYSDLASGKRDICAFLFARDLFGLAEKGRYVNSVQAVTGVTLYRFPLAELSAALKRDGEMQFAFLVKVTHQLRRSQRRAILINRRDAAGRLAMFLVFMTNNMGYTASGSSSVSLPMTRSDIAGFVGLSLDSVSRAAAHLEREGLVMFEDRHSARILDLARLTRLAAAV
jgi:CRP-like cAMP-binding protein